MRKPNNLEHLQAQMILWRHHFHQHPEIAFEEKETAAFIAAMLRDFGIKVHEGLGKTGVVGVLQSGTGSAKIALRADMDALPIQEQNTFSHKSEHPGKMHACGHDGHMAMLLGAAKALSEERNLNGTVYFIFQPAEEARAGAKALIDDGLFELISPDSIFALHNYPGLPAGHFSMSPGPIMASYDCFEISLHGKATHAAYPHLGNDVIVAGSQLVIALQTVVSRLLPAIEPSVVSVTTIQAGTTWNALPDTLLLRGTFRCFSDPIRNKIEESISDLTSHISRAYGVKSAIRFNPENPGYPVTVNSIPETVIAQKAALTMVGPDKLSQVSPSMGSEDFSFMLQKRPGCMAWLGNGPADNNRLLHNPEYDFNDAILSTGAAYWVELVKTILHQRNPALADC